MRHRIALLTLGVALAPLLAHPLAAQVTEPSHPDSTVYELEGVSVRVARPLVTIGGTSGIEVLLDSLDLPPSPTLEAVLREVPMLHVRTNSRGEAEVLARGSESRQVAILMDGIPVTLGWDGRTDLSALPGAAPQEIRFFRGLSTMLHGPNTLGGVVELVTVGEHTVAPRSAEFRSGIDETGGQAISASLVLPRESSAGSWLVRAGAGFRDAPGARLARGVVEPIPARRQLRLNTDARDASAYAAGRFRAGGGQWVALSGTGLWGSRGIAAELDSPAPRFWRFPTVERTIGVLSMGSGFHATPWGEGDVEASVGYDAGRTEIDAYTDRSYTVRNGFELGEDRTLTLRMLADHTLGERGDLSLSWTRASILHDEGIPTGSFRYRQRLSSLGAETVWRVGERIGPLAGVRLSLGGALDSAETLESADKPSIPRLGDWGARAGVNARLGTGSTTAHLGVSRRGRFPSLREAYSGALNRFTPNPELRPEHLTAAEAGITTRLGAAAHLQAVVFAQSLDDVIVRVALPNRRFMRVNENRMRTRGIELLGGTRAGPATLGGDLALQRAELIGSNSISRPENQPQLFGSAHGSLPLPGALRLRSEVRFTGAQHCLEPTGDERRLAGGTTLGGDLSRVWRVRGSGEALMSRLEARLSVDNLTGVALYDQCGLPQPGRMARMQLRLY